MIYGLFTLVMAIMDRQKKISWSQRILMPVVTLALPLAGLWLNRSEAFPVDLQSPWVYAWVVFNSLTLLPIQHRSYQLWSYPIGLISFSVTTYFFLVFLPYLPLFIIAIIAFGLGFLLLSPLALWTYQQSDLAEKKKLWDHWLGHHWSNTICFLLVALLPTITILRTVIMRHDLQSALTQVYEPWNPDLKPLPEDEKKRAAEALILHQEFKHGVHYPYLYLIHRSILFGGMVLSDSKCKVAYKTLTGQELPSVSEKSSFPGRDRRPRSLGGRTRTVKPSYDAKLLSFVLEQQQELRNEMEFTYKGTIENNDKTNHCEWNVQVSVPPGLLLTGVELNIDGSWVSAGIRDKKTALWIFEKIQEVRRDPIIVYHESDERLKIRVYPVPSSQKREFKLTFTAPLGFEFTSTFTDTRLDFNHINTNPSIWKGEKVALISSDHLKKVTAPLNRPYLHFIVTNGPRDESEVARLQLKKKLAARMLSVSRELEWPEAIFSIASSSLERVTLQPQSVDALVASEALDHLNFQPRSVAIDHCLQQALFDHRPQSTDALNLRRPEYIVILSESDDIPIPTELFPWNKFSPEFQGFSIASQRQINHFSFSDPKNAIQERVPLLPCQWYRCGSELYGLPLGKSGVFHAPSDSIEVYKNETWQTCSTQAMGKALNDDYSLSLESFHPWQRRTPLELLKEAKGRQLLIHNTAFIAVETQTQNNMLVRKEQQAMMQHEALDFEEVKASSPDDVAWLVIILLGCWWSHKKLKNSNIGLYS